MPRVSDTYNLQVLYPEIASECHPSRNGTLSPREITPGSGRKIWWQCRKAHEWQASVYSRTRGSGCPQCYRESIVTGKPVVTHGLLQEWHPSLNPGLNPRALTTAYNHKLWWLCRSGHEWQATLRGRLKGEGCPYCKKNGAYAGPEEPARPAGAYHPGRAKGFSLLDFDDDDVRDSYADTDFRREKRYPFSAAVMTEDVRRGSIIYAFLRNISPSGLHIETDYPIRDGEKVIVRIKEKISGSSPSSFTCRVKWCKERSDDSGNSIGYSIGLQVIG